MSFIDINLYTRSNYYGNYSIFNFGEFSQATSDPEDRSILVFRPHQLPELLQGNQQLPVLAEIDLQITVTQVFDWLKMF